MSDDAKTFMCPASSENYRGPCQIQRCWGHVNTDVHESGCAYQKLNKHELGLPELGYILDKPRKVLRDQIEQGKILLKNGIELLDQIDEIQGVGKGQRKGCVACGRKETTHKCLNQLKCTKRIKAISTFSAHPFFAQLDRPLDSYEFNLLLKNPLNRERVAVLLKFTDHQINQLENLFGG